MVYSGDLWALAALFSPAGDRTDSRTLNRLHDIAEHYGVSLRFYDEVISDEQGRIHETQPQYYGDILTFKIFDGVVWARDEIDCDSMVESYAELLADDMNNADTWGIDFSCIGFRRYEKQCESGWYPGQNDTPESLWKEVQEKFGESEVIFAIDGIGQFDVRFGAWYRTTQMKEDYLDA
jgi:hypothetical protein